MEPDTSWTVGSRLELLQSNVLCFFVQTFETLHSLSTDWS